MKVNTFINFLLLKKLRKNRFIKIFLEATKIKRSYWNRFSSRRLKLFYTLIHASIKRSFFRAKVLFSFLKKIYVTKYKIFYSLIKYCSIQFFSYWILKERYNSSMEWSRYVKRVRWRNFSVRIFIMCISFRLLKVLYFLKY